MGLGWNKVAPSPLQGPAGSPRTPTLVGSGPDRADLLPVAAPTRRQRRRALLSAFQPSASLAGFLPSHLALAHFRNKGNAGTSPLPGGAYYLILYPSITTSCGGIHYPRSARPPACPQAVGGVCGSGPHPFREARSGSGWALTTGSLGSLREVGPPLGALHLHPVAPPTCLSQDPALLA